MIVQGSKTQIVDVEVSAVSFISDLQESWQALIGQTGDIKAGYWVSWSPAGDVRGRLATKREIEVYNAFNVVFDVAQELE